MASNETPTAIETFQEAEVDYLLSTGWTRKEGGWAYGERTHAIILSQEAAVRVQRRSDTRDRLPKGKAINV